MTCDHLWKVLEWKVNKETFNFQPNYICMKCDAIREE